MSDYYLPLRIPMWPKQEPPVTEFEINFETDGAEGDDPQQWECPHCHEMTVTTRHFYERGVVVICGHCDRRWLRTHSTKLWVLDEPIKLQQTRVSLLMDVTTDWMWWQSRESVCAHLGFEGEGGLGWALYEEILKLLERSPYFAIPGYEAYPANACEGGVPLHGYTFDVWEMADAPVLKQGYRMDDDPVRRPIISFVANHAQQYTALQEISEQIRGLVDHETMYLTYYRLCEDLDGLTDEMKVLGKRMADKRRAVEEMVKFMHIVHPSPEL